MDLVFFAMKPGKTEYRDLLTAWQKFDDCGSRTWFKAKMWDRYDDDNV